MKQPFISVVTVVWNDNEHIEETIKSVISQTFSNYEYIIIDGNSTDGTVEIIKKYREYISTFLSEPDKGIYDAMNKAIAIAKGEWIIFMNSGDGFYSRTSMEDAFKNYIDNGEALIYGDFYMVNKSDEEDHQIKVMAETSHPIKVAPSCHQAIFTRTKELKKHPFDLKYKIIADFAFFYDLYKRNAKRYYTNSIICYYDFTGVSSTSRVSIMHEKATFYKTRHEYKKAIWFYIVYLKRKLLG